MSPTRTRVPDDVIPILRRSTFNGNVLTLPEQLPRETYLRVAKVLTAARGKWNPRPRPRLPLRPARVDRRGRRRWCCLNARRRLRSSSTPDALVQRLIGLFRHRPGETALEPSAGLGRIAKQPLAKGVNVVAVEIDATNAKVARANSATGSRYTASRSKRSRSARPRCSTRS